MKINSLFSKPEDNIAHSIAAYRKSLMEDMNLTLRLIANDITYLTKPADWSDDALIFEAPMTGLDYVIFLDNTVINAIFVSKTGLFQATLRITSKYRKDTNLYYTAEIISPLVKRQQRADFRLEVILDTQYQLFITHPKPDTDLLKGRGVCLNISVGGMCLSTPHQFRAKDLIKLDFTLIQTPLSIVGEVLYLGEHTESGNYTHRIRFVDMDKQKSNLLRQLIFQKQRLQLKYQNQ